MTEDEVAALDGDWSASTPKERAAYAFARKISFEPHKFDDADKQQQADQKQAQSAADQFAAMQAQLRDILGKLQDILARSNKTNAI